MSEFWLCSMARAACARLLHALVFWWPSAPDVNDVNHDGSDIEMDVVEAQDGLSRELRGINGSWPQLASSMSLLEWMLT